ncbi:hypothetical protein FQZ97_1272860 [compost metagenome]
MGTGMCIGITAMRATLPTACGDPAAAGADAGMVSAGGAGAASARSASGSAGAVAGTGAPLEQAASWAAIRTTSNKRGPVGDMVGGSCE